MTKTKYLCYISSERYSMYDNSDRSLYGTHLLRATLIARNTSVIFYGERL